MKLSCYLAVGLLAFASCKAPLNPVTRTENLPLHEVTVNTDRDTVLVFPEGLKISIPAGALSSKNKQAKLEVREALTIADMIRAGLTTTTNGHLLRSGGMFCIQPASGEEITIAKPLTVEVPASDISDGMHLYDGVSVDGQLNWTNPKPIVDSNNTSLAIGTRLFEQNCASCHLPTRPLTGPALYHAVERWGNDTAAITAFIRNNFAMYGDVRAKCAYFERSSEMTLFPDLTDKEIKAILEYIELEGRKAVERGAYKEKPIEPYSICYYAKREAQKLKDWIEEAEKEKAEGIEVLHGDYGYYYYYYYDDFVTRTDLRTADTIPGTGKVTEAGLDENGNERKARFYTINVDNFGWKNVDEETRAIATARACKLSVTLTQPADPSMHIFLVIPDDKIFSLGGLLADGKSYGFYGTDSTVYLPMNKSAYILAVAETNDKFLFGMTHFVTSQEASLQLTVKEADSRAFEEAISRIGGDKGLSATVNKIKDDDPLPHPPKGASLKERYAYWKAFAEKCSTGK